MEIYYDEQDFSYPTNKEWKEVNKSKPIFKLFSFPVVNELEELISNKPDPKTVHKNSHLYLWNICLKHKIESLIHAYSFALVNFNRGVPDDLNTYQHKNYVNRGMFDFYCETYFYFFVSVQDTIWHIANIYYDMGFEEYKPLPDKNGIFFKKVSNDVVVDRIKQFIKETETTTKYRNRFTHRFLVTHPDYRPSLSEKDGLLVFGGGRGDFDKSSTLANHMKISIDQLASFITDLSKLMPQFTNSLSITHQI